MPQPDKLHTNAGSRWPCPVTMTLDDWSLVLVAIGRSETFVDNYEHFTIEQRYSQRRIIERLSSTIRAQTKPLDDALRGIGAIVMDC